MNKEIVTILLRQLLIVLVTDVMIGVILYNSVGFFFMVYELVVANITLAMFCLVAAIFNIILDYLGLPGGFKGNVK